MLIAGNCHCGNITFALTWEPDPSEIPARACTCSFCTKHGGVWTTTPTGSLKVTVGNSSLVSRYAFGTETAQFHICSQCGVVPVVTSRIEDRLYAQSSVSMRSRAWSRPFFGARRQRSRRERRNSPSRGASGTDRQR